MKPTQIIWDFFDCFGIWSLNTIVLTFYDTLSDCITFI